MKTALTCLAAGLVFSCANPAFAQDGGSAAERDELERHFELITVGELAFTNVWVNRQTNFNILISHQGGIHTIKLTDLPAGELAELKSQIGDLADIAQPGEAPKATALIDKLKAFFKEATPRTWAIVGSAALLVVALITAALRRDKAPAPK
jgi:hypothetical protein